MQGAKKALSGINEDDREHNHDGSQARTHAGQCSTAKTTNTPHFQLQDKSDRDCGCQGRPEEMTSDIKKRVRNKTCEFGVWLKPKTRCEENAKEKRL